MSNRPRAVHDLPEPAPVSGLHPSSLAEPAHCVLLIDENPAIRRVLARILGSMGCTVLSAGSAATARALCRARPVFLLAIMDLTLSDVDGADLVTELRDQLGDDAPPFVLYSENEAPAEAPEGVVAVLVKPVGMPELLTIVRDEIALRADPSEVSPEPAQRPTEGPPPRDPREARNTSAMAITEPPLPRFEGRTLVVEETGTAVEQDPRRER